MELEHLLSKVLVTDRTTVHVVNSTWQDGLHVALKLWACAVLHVTFPADYKSRLFDQKLVCLCEKTRMRKGHVTQGYFEWCSLTAY